MSRRPTFLSVFSGIGGLDLGLEAAGFRPIGLIEKCPLCRQILKLNKPRWRQLPWNDVHDAAKQLFPRWLGLQVGELELLAGGSPCQPFSTAAQWSISGRRGLADTRARTLISFLRLARSFLPKTILLENVPSIWSAELGVQNRIKRFFKRLARETNVRYALHVAVLNAADYGVPQVRRRAILIARRDDAPFQWPRRSHLGRTMSAWDALHATNPKCKPSAHGKWAGLLPSIPEGWNYLWHTDHGDGITLFGYRTKFWSFLLKLAKDKPSWTLAAQPGPSTGPFHWENRPLASEELLSLQTFPQDWELMGTYRDHVRLIGNATPPLLAESLGIAIRGVRPGAGRKYLPVRARSVAPATAPLPVARKYLKLIDVYPPHPGVGKGPRPRAYNVAE